MLPVPFHRLQKLKTREGNEFSEVTQQEGILKLNPKLGLCNPIPSLGFPDTLWDHSWAQAV
jgi:hypothetical protein